jgi:hypothetical protein
MNVTWAIGAAARTNGLLSAAEGDLVAGEASLEEAVATIAETGDPFDLARTLLALGTVQRQAR